jgi:hypothetical protein
MIFHPAIRSLLIGLDLRGARAALHIFRLQVPGSTETMSLSNSEYSLDLLQILQFQHSTQEHGARWELEPAYFLARDDTPMFRADEVCHKHNKANTHQQPPADE